MADTIDLGEVKIKVAAAKKALQDLDAAVAGVGERVEDAGDKGSTAFDAIASGARSVATAAGVAAAAAGVLAQQITAGAIAAERNAVALRGLGSTYQLVQSATMGAVTAQQAFHAQNQLTQSGLRVSGEQMATIARAAREFALRTGTDAADAMNQLTSALVAGDARAMRPFGISVQVGTLRTQAFRQALGQLGAQQAQTARSAETLEEATARLGRAWEAFRNDVSAAAAETLGLKGAFQELADALESLVDGGPLVHNFFAGILEDITGIQQSRRGTAEDNARNADQDRRERMISAAGAWQGLVDFHGMNLQRVSGPDAQRLYRALTTRGNTVEQVQAEIDRTAGILRVDSQRTQAAVAAAGRPNVAQNAADDHAERTRDMSAADTWQLEQDKRQAREQLRSFVVSQRRAGIRVDPQWIQTQMRRINGFLDPANRRAFEGAMSGSSILFSREMEIRGFDTESARMGLAEYQTDAGSPGAGAQAFAAIFGARGAATARTADREQTLFERYGSGLSESSYAQLIEGEAGKEEARASMAATSRGLLEREDLKTQLVGFFSDTETLAEKGAKGFTNAFQTMSGAVSGFVDALIEGQQPAGEAAIGLAKAALKGLAMQAVPEALFETAKGLAAVATGNPMAATHFAAAGVYTAVAVAAGGAAAGINAAQRGATPSAAASAAGPLGSTLPSSSGGGRDSRPIVINVNGTVMDREGYENAVLDGLNGALARGGRMAA